RDMAGKDMTRPSGLRRRVVTRLCLTWLCDRPTAMQPGEADAEPGHRRSRLRATAAAGRGPAAKQLVSATFRPMTTVLNGIDEIRAAVGTHLGYSDWLEITQARIDQFADATGDHQWIHVDPVR